MGNEIAVNDQPAGTNWIPWLWICAFHLGALLAFVPAYFTWQALGVCLILHWFTTGIGISMAYHRLLTHRSFAVRPKVLEYILTAIGSCGAQGGALSMVSDHRRHHAYTEQEHDPHSPVNGLYWAHWRWWVYKNPYFLHTREYYAHWAPDLLRDPVHRMLQSIHFVFPLSLLVALYATAGCPGWSGAGSSGTFFVSMLPGRSTRSVTGLATATSRPAMNRRTTG